MHPCAQLLEEAELLLEQEEAALAEEDAERLAQLVERRVICLNDAWEARNGYDELLLHKRLRAMEARQSSLEVNARSLHERLRETLSTTRKQNQYYAGYRSQNAMAQRANYITRIS